MAPRSKSKFEKVIVVIPLETVKLKEDSKDYTKDQFINLISKASNKQGDKLLHLMDLCESDSLSGITLEQARDYYYRYILDII